MFWDIVSWLVLVVQTSVLVFSFCGAIALFSYQLSVISYQKRALPEQVWLLYRLFDVYRG
ncbi:MAG: hypothetical protein F6K39_05535 [Okeania sp. SIO3B3]|nr:hypothetical protein [Okeania sp. SIO3B3]